MRETDRISVLVCVHSQDELHDDLLLRALGTLVDQTYQDFETVVLFDECWEHTYDRASLHYDDALNPTWLSKPKKEGLAVAKNFGIKRCSGDWIAFLDADDQYMDCKLAEQRKFLMNNPHIDVCGTLAWDLNDDRIITSCFKPGQYDTHTKIAERLPYENIMCHGSMMIRRSALEQIGGYVEDKEMLGKEDWATWMNLLEGGFQFHNIPERLYVWSANTSVAR